MSSSPSPSALGAAEVKLEFVIHAPVGRVWAALTQDIQAWWPATFYTSERTSAFVLEPTLGGMMGEVFGPGEGLVWYRVIGLERERQLLLSGYLMPPWAGPGVSLLRIELSEMEPGQTRFEFTDSTFGKLGDCSNAEGWREIFGQHFKRHVERTD